MGMTITEKILAAHAGRDKVYPGELIIADVDIALGNDVTAPIAIKEFEKTGAKKVFDKDKIVLVPDHFTPNKDIASAEHCRILRDFAKKYGITHYFEIGEVGIEHVLLPEQGIVLPGEVVIGADSHTCTYGALGAFSTGVGSTDLAAAMVEGKAWFKVPETIKFVYTGKLKKWVSGKDLILYTIGKIGVDGALYKAMEFTGPALKYVDMAGRFSMANMAIEAGAKNGIFIPDSITEEYVSRRAKKKYTFYDSDSDASYSDVIKINTDGIELQVACPNLPENVKPVSELRDVELDQVVIGSCTNGRIEDFRIAARIMKGQKIAKYLRCIIIPGSQSVYLEALNEGLLEIFIKAGAAVSAPTCGPCLGGHMGILASGEKALATTNRNFVGRMGHPKSKVYLSGPAVAAASAVKGKIVSPEEVLK
ncbi:MAG: 3-isopropylmalate dehydratase large subunit [Candidatus Aureabacteria bacterium]|nr:3-isopropylmalate dehydratase large subunit [Candidatus Auribacterota bacterium]